jgi:formamidopyrimidine-DNA glycosylase
MPELPEVHTTTEGLRKVLPSLSIVDVWTNVTTKDKRQKDSVKNPAFFIQFRKQIRGTKIISVSRRAKNILIDLSNGQTILVHMKMTGHLLYGKYSYNKKEDCWMPSTEEKNDALRDPYNRFVRVVFSLSNGKHLAFCDSRKFGKITLIETLQLETSKHLSGIGPEPLTKEFSGEEFTKQLYKKPNGKIKTVLMDQSVIAGIGNIYSDEMLWLSGIHPLSRVASIPQQKIKELFVAMKTVLNKGIDFGGDSTSDYRDIHGNHGKFHHAHNAYRLTGELCRKRGCGGTIERKMIGGRSAHFCNKHQKLFIQ